MLWKIPVIVYNVNDRTRRSSRRIKKTERKERQERKGKTWRKFKENVESLIICFWATLERRKKAFWERLATCFAPWSENTMNSEAQLHIYPKKVSQCWSNCFWRDALCTIYSLSYCDLTLGVVSILSLKCVRFSCIVFL